MKTKKKLCIFPSDPLQAYVAKGEIKPRYFNPNNFFDEVHFMNPTNESIDSNSVQELVGSAVLYIHNIGKNNIFSMHLQKKTILKQIKTIRPDIIRSYNSLIQGWLASFCSRKLKIPYVLSIHGDYKNEIEKEYKSSGKIIKFLKLWLTRNITQKDSISLANVVTCIHKGLIPYIKECGGKNIEVLYNRVNLEQFRNGKLVLKKDKPIILNVGNLRKIKNQECLIHAIEGLDVYLILIGKGKMLQKLKSLTNNLGLKKNVIFIDSVKHSEIQDYYASAKIFAMPLKGSGITIPTLEALASGCITIVAKPDRKMNEPYDSVINYVENTPEGFRKEFQDIFHNEEKYFKQKKKASELLMEMDETIMEEKESKIYESLIFNK